MRCTYKISLKTPALITHNRSRFKIWLGIGRWALEKCNAALDKSNCKLIGLEEYVLRQQHYHTVEHESLGDPSQQLNGWMKIGMSLIQNQSHYHDVIFPLAHSLLEHFGTEPRYMFKMVRYLNVQVAMMVVSIG